MICFVSLSSTVQCFMALCIASMIINNNRQMYKGPSFRAFCVVTYVCMVIRMIWRDEFK